MRKWILLLNLFALSIFLRLVSGQQCLYSRKWDKQSFRLNKRQRLVKTKLDFSMIIDDTDQVVSNHIKSTGIWQESIVNMILHLVKQGDYVLNLGSQTGMQILAIAKVIRQTGRIFVFEPSRVSYNMMRKNLLLNGFGSISTTYNMGASNEFQIGKLLINQKNTGASKIVDVQRYSQKSIQIDQLNREYLHQKVILARVDQVLDQNLVLDFALIDVQGMEIQAIDGMRKIIDRSPNLIIVSEWQYGILRSVKSRELFQKVVIYLFDKGYKIYQIFGIVKGCTIPLLIQKIDLQSLIIKQDINLLMIPPTKKLPNY